MWLQYVIARTIGGKVEYLDLGFGEHRWDTSIIMAYVWNYRHEAQEYYDQVENNEQRNGEQ